MRKKIVIVLTLAFPLSLLAQQEPAPAGPQRTVLPPEAQKIVRTLIGQWSGPMSATVPGVEPESFEWRIECRPTALGTGAACTMEGEPSIGRIEQACVLGYDPEGKALHYMCVNSMGEVHDHKGMCKGEASVEFDPLAGSMTGQPITETITWTFPDADTFVSRSVVAMGDGSEMRFEYTGKRV